MANVGGIGRKPQAPCHAVAEDEEGEEWEVVPESAAVATDANANDLVPPQPPLPADAAVDAPPISPFAAAQPGPDAQVRYKFSIL